MVWSVILMTNMLKTYNLKVSPGFAQTAWIDSAAYVCRVGIAYTLLKRVAQPTVHAQRASAL